MKHNWKRDGGETIIDGVETGARQLLMGLTLRDQEIMCAVRFKQLGLNRQIRLMETGVVSR